MATHFIFGAVGQCPTCADHHFSSPGDAFPLPALREKSGWRFSTAMICVLGFDVQYRATA
jgi:hypothetical protein